MYRNILLTFLFILVSIPFLLADEGEENTLTWPREMEIENTIVTLYQSHHESFKNNVLSGRRPGHPTSLTMYTVIGMAMSSAGITTATGNKDRAGIGRTAPVIIAINN